MYKKAGESLESSEVEKGLICSILLDEKVLDGIVNLVSPDDFYSKRNGTIYRAALTLYGNGHPVDGITLIDELKRTDKLEYIGGPLYLAELVDTVPLATNVVRYAKIIKECSLKRSLMSFFDDIKKKSLPDSYSEILDKLYKKITTTSDTNSEVSSISASDLQKVNLPDIVWAVPGIMPEGLTVLAGKPKKGKSLLCLNIAFSISTGGEVFGCIESKKGDVIYLALEDTWRSIQRTMKIMSPDTDWPENMFIYTNFPRASSGGSVLLRKEIEKLENPRLLIIDTFAKFRDLSIKEGYNTDYNDIGIIKSIADHYGISVIVVHHLRKMASDDVFDSISGTLGITGAADGIIVMTRDGRKADLHITGRGVEQKEISLGFDKSDLSWSYMGDSDEVSYTYNQEKVISAITEYGELSPSEIAEVSGLKRVYVQNKALPRLLDLSVIRKSDRGKYKLNQS
ncbi:MAG: AAA family ATPase [Desulfobacteraceae bacterium]|nr:AAA family ATPase [Desulfobacteraceae bacterium]